MYNMSDIGNRIREIRKIRHYTQEEASELLSISKKHYSEIERGLTGLSFDLFFKICEVFNVSSDFLLFGNSNTLPPQLLKRFDECSDDKKEQIIQIMLSILEL